MTADVQAEAPPDARYGGGRAAVLVVALMLALTLSFIDRQILALLIEPIKADLRISDTQFGILQGVAFAVFYIGFGFPLGRLADKGNRRNLIAGGIATWSIMTAGCGTATSFLGLFGWRAGVGVGEAALSPAGYSMIADAVPKRRLSLALGTFSMGVYLGSGLSLLVGGALIGYLSGPDRAAWLGQMEAWRLVFFAVGIPGVLMALCMLVAVREPMRRLFGRVSEEQVPTLRETLRFVLDERRIFGGLMLGFAFHNAALYGLLSWVPAFLGRSFALSPAQVGQNLGFYTMLGGVTGLAVGGWLSDRLVAAGRSDGPLLVGIFAMVGIATMTLLTVSADSALTAARLFAVVMFCLALPIGGVAAALQLVVPNRLRGQVSALYLIVISIVGLTLGPILPPAISDGLLGGPAKIGDGLAIAMCLAAVCAVTLLALARSSYVQRYTALHSTEE